MPLIALDPPRALQRHVETQRLAEVRPIRQLAALDLGEPSEDFCAA
jgi:hypothetical protein